MSVNCHFLFFFPCMLSCACPAQIQMSRPTFSLLSFGVVLFVLLAICNNRNYRDCLLLMLLRLHVALAGGWMCCQTSALLVALHGSSGSGRAANNDHLCVCVCSVCVCTVGDASQWRAPSDVMRYTCKQSTRCSLCPVALYFVSLCPLFLFLSFPLFPHLPFVFLFMPHHFAMLFLSSFHRTSTNKHTHTYIYSRTQIIITHRAI